MGFVGPSLGGMGWFFMAHASKDGTVLFLLVWAGVDLWYGLVSVE